MQPRTRSHDYATNRVTIRPSLRDSVWAINGVFGRGAHQYSPVRAVARLENLANALGGDTTYHRGGFQVSRPQRDPLVPIGRARPMPVIDVGTYGNGYGHHFALRMSRSPWSAASLRYPRP